MAKYTIELNRRAGPLNGGGENAYVVSVKTDVEGWPPRFFMLDDNVDTTAFFRRVGEIICWHWDRHGKSAEPVKIGSL